jgi:NMD protein affecting ribosome stability and mRNA decay
MTPEEYQSLMNDVANPSTFVKPTQKVRIPMTCISCGAEYVLGTPIKKCAEVMVDYCDDCLSHGWEKSSWETQGSFEKLASHYPGTIKQCVKCGGDYHLALPYIDANPTTRDLCFDCLPKLRKATRIPKKTTAVHGSD